MGNNRPARLSDVQLAISEPIWVADGATIHVSGLVMHSAISVQSVQVSREGDTRRITMVIGLTQPDQSGSFDIDIPIDEHTDRVVFGAEGASVWQREAVT